MSFQRTPNNHDEENNATGYNLRRRTVTTGTGAVPKTTTTKGPQNTPRNNHRGTNDNPVTTNNEGRMNLGHSFNNPPPNFLLTTISSNMPLNVGLNNQNIDERVNSHSVLDPHFPVYNIRSENFRAVHFLSPSRDIPINNFISNNNIPFRYDNVNAGSSNDSDLENLIRHLFQSMRINNENNVLNSNRLSEIRCADKKFSLLNFNNSGELHPKDFIAQIEYGYYSERSSFQQFEFKLSNLFKGSAALWSRAY
ncbi:hypothetical protein HHI36_004881 [Cryptolaemus montrouzieri]|uniref:Uncharacterized protein n=1 Tax=Cryptolaemus montrouzieri TaxID=559131 RepID=A0ABD2NU18_9CUCU